MSAAKTTPREALGPVDTGPAERWKHILRNGAALRLCGEPSGGITFPIERPIPGIWCPDCVREYERITGRKVPA